MLVNFTGSIVSADGKVIYQRVSGTIDHRRGKNFSEWDGELTIESGEMPSLFQGFVVTDAGRRAEMFATEMNFGSNTIAFQGSGPPPFDHP